MKARILIVTVAGSLALVGSSAGAVISGDGGAPAAQAKRAPTALRHHTMKWPWEAPNRWQVSRDAI